MKKIVVLLLTLALAFTFASCGNKDSSNQKEEKLELSEMTATEILEELKEKGYPISEITTYTEDTDPNGILGKQGEYYDKALGVDTRITQDGFPAGIDIEIFKNEKDAKARQDYINSFTGFLRADTDNVVYGGVLVRINIELTQSQADQYLEAIKELYETGSIPKYEISEEDKTAKENAENGIIDDCQIKDITAEKTAKEDGTPCVIVRYTLVNNSDEAVERYDAVYLSVEQSGVDIDSVYIEDDSAYEANASIINAGEEKQFSEAYATIDDSPITVKFTNTTFEKTVSRELDI